MHIQLTWHEAAQAAYAGVQRHLHNLARNRRDTYGFNGDGWGIHIEGAAGEMALAKLTGAYWEPVVSDPFALNGDVGNRQVRTTHHQTGCLIVHPSDLDDAEFVLVTGKIPRFDIIGTIRGRDAKREGWWREGQPGRPAFFVPQTALDPWVEGQR